MGIDCNGACSAACFGCSNMCAYTAENPEHITLNSPLSSAGEASSVEDERIKSIPTECSSCGAQAEIRQMGFLFIKECPYCKKKEVISI